MSLLLDALKKAEQSKREKVAEVAGGRRGPSGQPPGGAPGPGGAPDLELRLEPLPEEGLSADATGLEAGGPREPEAGSGRAEPSPSAGEAAGSSTLRFERESGVSGGPRVATGELDLEEFARKLSEAGPPTIETGALGVAELREGSVTAAQTMPSLKNVQAALREFYGENTGARPAPRASEPPPRTTGATSAIETQTSQRAARNVFEAKEPPARKRRKALVPLGVTAVALTGLLVGGYYATRSLTTVRPSTLAVCRPAPIPVAPAPVASAPAAAAPAPLASAPAPAAPAPLASAPAAPTVVAQAPAAAAPAVAPAPPVAPAPAAAPAAPTVAPTTPTVAAAPPPQPAPARPAVRGVKPSDEEAYRLALAGPSPARPQAPAAGPVASAASAPAPAAPTAAASAPAPAASPPASAESAPVVRALPSTRSRASSPVRVMSRSEPDPTYVRLDRAYQAFQSGDYEQARQLYREVLTRDPRNRDALLGLGAVATAQGEGQQAQAVYRRVLSQNPGDRVATAAISNLGMGPGAAAPQGEARLKQALAQDPGAPYLNFSLGNLYASQRRWSEAQQAYFNAYRADSRNADYAFNLAVSLDRLGKPRQALEYYRRALETAGQQSAFSTDAVRTRIQVLEAAGSREGS